MNWLRKSAGLVLALVLVACGNGEQPAEPTPTPTPEELAASIGRATQDGESVAFRIELSGSPVSVLDGGLFTLVNIQGDLKRPDGLLAVLSVRSFGGLAEVRTISMEGAQYITNPITREWNCLEPGAAFDPVVLFDPERGVEAILQNELNEVTLVGETTLDGQAVYHLRALIEPLPLRSISSGLLGVGPVELDLFADRTTLQAARIVLVDTGTGIETDSPSTWTVDFSDYGKPVDVREPIECPS